MEMSGMPTLRMEAGNILGMNGPRPGSCVMCQLGFLFFSSGANSVSELLWVSLGSFLIF